MDGVTATDPVIPRRYTLTHSDNTGELFLSIGLFYNWEKINPLRDEVIGEWLQYGTSLFFYVYVHIDQGEYSPSISSKRNEIFRRELPLALHALKYGDRLLFKKYPCLGQSPIIITFMSAYPQFAKQESWVTFQHFDI